jgi:hypothetical protein
VHAIRVARGRQVTYGREKNSGDVPHPQSIVGKS